MVDLEKPVREREKRSIVLLLWQWWCGCKWPGAVLLLAAVLSAFTYEGGRYAWMIFVIPGIIAACEIVWYASRTNHVTAIRMAEILLFDISIGMGSGVVLLDVPYGREIIAIVAAGTFCNDIFAQVTGTLWGSFCKHAGRTPAKIFPKASPNKTWVGTWGGIIAGVAAGLATTDLVNKHWTPLPWWVLVIVLITPPLAVWGDWMESCAKRALGIKDFGRILGKTGGFCDRIDAIAPALTGALVVVLAQPCITWLLLGR